jgi:hypothetical protein
MAHPDVIDLLSDSENDDSTSAAQNPTNEMAPDKASSHNGASPSRDNVEALLDKVLLVDNKDAKAPPTGDEILCDEELVYDDDDGTEDEPMALAKEVVDKSCQRPDAKSGPQGAAQNPSKTNKGKTRRSQSDVPVLVQKNTPVSRFSKPSPPNLLC